MVYVIHWLCEKYLGEEKAREMKATGLLQI
jgi:hypothetical protein